MIELSRHIECLLVKHNCVIIPEFGGFVTQYVPAHFVKEEGLFLPPYRSIGFNPELQHNDGLLVQSYMQTHDTNYTETLSIISSAVQQLKEELQDKGCVDMNGVGLLMLGVNGNYDFEPYESGVVSPELYGLDSFSAVRRSPEELRREKAIEKKSKKSDAKKKPVRILHKSKRHYMLSLNREVVNYVAAAIVAIAFYFAWASPSALMPEESGRQASVFSITPQSAAEVHSTVSDVQQTEATPAEELATIVADTVAIESKETLSGEAMEMQEMPTANEVVQAPSATSTKEYTIVLMSHITKKSALTAIETFKAQGLSEVHMTNARIMQVAFGSYPSFEDAEADLGRVRECTGIADAWVMKVKKTNE